MDLNKYAEYVYNVAKNKGFHKNDIFGNFVANIHGECSELWEAYRKDKLNELCDKYELMRQHNIEPLTCIEEELADIIIRSLDIAHTYNIDIEKAIKNKMKYNETREYRHGNKLA